MARATSTAKTEGYTVLSDGELTQIVEGRLRQLESELAGHRMLAEEQEADPHASEQSIEETQKTIESLEARLPVLGKRHAALKASSGDEAAANS